MIDLTNQKVIVSSNNKQTIILKWPDMQIHLNIENTKKLIKSLQIAIEYEEGVLNDKSRLQ
jgi:hypothetical protein